MLVINARSRRLGTRDRGKEKKKSIMKSEAKMKRKNVAMEYACSYSRLKTTGDEYCWKCFIDKFQLF